MSTTPILEKQVRCISSAALYVNTSGVWELGALGTPMQNLVPVQFQGLGVSDQTFAVEALRAEKTPTGFELTLRSKANPNELYTLTVSDSGLMDVSSIKSLSLTDVLTLEASLGADLNATSSLGDDSAVLDEGLVDVLVGPDGAISVQSAVGGAIALSYSDGPLYYQDLQDEGLDILEVLPDDAGFSIYMADMAGGDIYLLAANASGGIESFELLWVWDEELGDYLDVTDADWVDDEGAQEDLSSEVELEAQFDVDIQNDQDKALEPGWTGELQNSFLRTTIEAATANGGSMGYNATVGLFQGLLADLAKAGQTQVTESLMTDLKAMAARGKALFSSTSFDGQDSEYLASVVGSIVNGSVANGVYTGGLQKAVPLKNLTSGSSTDTLSLLVNKWLLGKDLPTPAVGGDSANPNAYSALGSYKTFGEVLFADTPTVSDIRQGSFGDCYLLACLQAIADAQPKALQNMFVPNTTVDGARSWGVRFYDFAGKETWVTVNDQLPVSSSTAAATTDNLIIGRSSNANEIWVPLLEKAYAQVNETGILRRESNVNSFIAIEGGLFDPIVSILGAGRLSSIQNANIGWGSSPIDSVSTTAENRQALIAAVAKDINSGKPVGLASFVNTSTSSGETLYAAPHAYFLDDADPTSSTNLTVKVYNPWGVSLGLSSGTEHVSPFEANLEDLINTWPDGTRFYLQVYDYSGPGAVVSGGGTASNLASSGALQSKLSAETATPYNQLLTAGNDLLVGDAGANALYGGYGNDSLTGLSGNDTLDGGSGTDVVVVGASATHFELKFSSSNLQLRSKTGDEGTDTLTNMERIQFADKTVIIESRAHSSYADVPDALYQFFVVGFGAAAGVTYMDQMAEAYRYWLAPYGQDTVKKIVGVFTTKTQFTSVYPQALVREDGGKYYQYSHDLSQASKPMVRGAEVSQDHFKQQMASLAQSLVNQIVKSSATAEAKAAAVQDIQNALALGGDWTIGQVIYTVFGNLASKPLSDAVWGGTAKQFANQTAVAKYYTDVLSQSTDDMSTLQKILQPITHETDVGTPEAIATLIGVALEVGV